MITNAKATKIFILTAITFVGSPISPIQASETPFSTEEREIVNYFPRAVLSKLLGGEKDISIVSRDGVGMVYLSTPKEGSNNGSLEEYENIKLKYAKMYEEERIGPEESFEDFLQRFNLQHAFNVIQEAKSRVTTPVPDSDNTQNRTHLESDLPTKDFGSTTIEAYNILLGDTAIGTVPDADYDFFAITLNAPTSITAETIGDNDTIGMIVDENGNEIAFNDESGTNHNFKIQWKLDPGKYYIGVAGGYDAVPPGEYTLQVYEKDFPDDYGNSITKAHLIQLGTEVTGNLEVTGDIDMFKITLPTSMLIEVRTYGFPDLAQYLMDNSGFKIVSFGQYYKDPSLFTKIFLDAGTYYIQVGNFEDAANISYSMIVQQIVDDYGNSMEQAHLVHLGDSVTGELEYERDVDMFKIEVASAMEMVIAINNNDYYMQLIDSNGNVITTSDSVIYRNFDPGTYYIKVASLYNSGVYTIYITEPGPAM